MNWSLSLNRIVQQTELNLVGLSSHRERESSTHRLLGNEHTLHKNSSSQSIYERPDYSQNYPHTHRSSFSTRDRLTSPHSKSSLFKDSKQVNINEHYGSIPTLRYEDRSDSKNNIFSNNNSHSNSVLLNTNSQKESREERDLNSAKRDTNDYRKLLLKFEDLEYEVRMRYEKLSDNLSLVNRHHEEHTQQINEIKQYLDKNSNFENIIDSVNLCINKVNALEQRLTVYEESTYDKIEESLKKYAKINELNSRLDDQHSKILNFIRENNLQNLRSHNKRIEDLENSLSKALHNMESTVGEKHESLRLQVEYKLNKMENKKGPGQNLIDEVSRMSEIITKNEERYNRNFKELFDSFKKNSIDNLEDFIESSITQKMNDNINSLTNKIEIPDYGECIQKITNKLYNEFNEIKKDMQTNYYTKNQFNEQYNDLNKHINQLDMSIKELSENKGMNIEYIDGIQELNNQDIEKILKNKQIGNNRNINIQEGKLDEIEFDANKDINLNNKEKKLEERIHSISKTPEPEKGIEMTGNNDTNIKEQEQIKNDNLQKFNLNPDKLRYYGLNQSDIIFEDDKEDQSRSSINIGKNLSNINIKADSFDDTKDDHQLHIKLSSEKKQSPQANHDYCYSDDKNKHIFDDSTPREQIKEINSDNNEYEMLKSFIKKGLQQGLLKSLLKKSRSSGEFVKVSDENEDLRDSQTFMNVNNFSKETCVRRYKKEADEFIDTWANDESHYTERTQESYDNENHSNEWDMEEDEFNDIEIKYENMKNSYAEVQNHSNLSYEHLEHNDNDIEFN